jgi:hypothetical protein
MYLYRRQSAFIGVPKELGQLHGQQQKPIGTPMNAD